MKKTAIMFIVAALIAYGLDWFVRKVKYVVKYWRIQRRIDKAMKFMATDEYKKQVNEFANEVMDSLNL